MSRSLNATSKSKSATSSEVIVSKAFKKIKSGSRKKVQSALNGANRQEMIATAAYYRAEQQGFNCGHEIQDWLEAEAEIDNLLQNSK
jgi:hypothetical protein